MSTEQGQSRILKIISLICLVSFVLAVIITIVFFTWWGNKDRFVFGKEKFDQVAWITANSHPEKSCHRGDMAYDLQQNILFPGAPRDKVMMLLGRPTWEEENQIEYDLGSCMHVIHGLRLFFNQDNQLTHSRIVQH